MKNVEGGCVLGGDSRMSWGHRVRTMLFSVLGAMAVVQLYADTFVPTTNTTTTWTKAGSRYIVPASTTVASGHTLTIEAGVEVVLGPEVRFIVSGRIRALGTREDPIIFRSTTPDTRWETIFVPDSGSEPSSEFRWCRFSNANRPLWLVARSGETETQQVSNCVFEDCGVGVLAQSIGESARQIPPNRLNPLIQNCRFVNCDTNGIHFVLMRSGDGTPYDRPGMANPIIRGNTFLDIGEAAINFAVEAGGASQPQVINNSIMNVPIGVLTQAPYDVVVKNNLFVGCESAVQRTTVDNLNLLVNYNNFHNNGTNFFNYPSNYGSTIWDNANGDPADIYLNIFEDPMIEDAETLTLAAGSPCIDAGHSTGEYLDSCLPPSQGTTANDIGAYGGPSGCGWLGGTPTVFNLELEPLIGVTIHPVRPGVYRLEYAPVVGDTNVWTQLTTVTLDTTPWSYADHTEGQRFYRALLLE